MLTQQEMQNLAEGFDCLLELYNRTAKKDGLYVKGFFDGFQESNAVEQDSANYKAGYIDGAVALLAARALAPYGLKVKVETPPPAPVIPTSQSSDMVGKLKKVKAKTEGFTGNQCTQCFSMKMLRAGTCELCQDCGTTTGCS